MHFFWSVTQGEGARGRQEGAGGGEEGEVGHMEGARGGEEGVCVSSPHMFALCLGVSPFGRFVCHSLYVQLFDVVLGLCGISTGPLLLGHPEGRPLQEGL